MCYILYGAVDKSINSEEYSKAIDKSKYKFALGTRHDVKMCIVNDSGSHRITKWACDCDFPTGKHNKDAKEIQDLASLINDLKIAKDAKYIYISLAWAGKKVSSECCLSINDIDVAAFLADMESDCLYRIDFN